MAHLDIDTTTLEIAATALARFKLVYPERLTIWVETAEGQLDVKIGSIAKIGSIGMRQHIFVHETQTFMEM